MEIKKDMMKLKMKEIRMNPHQPRKNFDEGKILVLADSIKEFGVNTPIQLSWCEGKDGKKATLVDGERRIKAMKKAGYKELEYGKEYIIVDAKTDDDYEYKGLIANCMREDLQPAEKGDALMSLMKRHGVENVDIAISVINRAKDYVNNNFIAEPSKRNHFIPKETIKKIARDMKTIGVSGTNAVDLLKITQLPKDIQKKVIFAPPNFRIHKEKVKVNRFGKMQERKDDGEKIPISFARELARLENTRMIRFYVDKAIKNSWTSKKMKMMVNDFLSSRISAEKYIERYKQNNKRCNKERKNTKKEIEALTREIDSFASMLTSFRTINLVAMANVFNQKMFLVSSKGLRTATKKLLDDMDKVLDTTKEVLKKKDERKEQLPKKPFRVRLGKQPHMKAKAYRFTIPKEIGEALKLEYGDEVEMQINAVYRAVEDK